MSGENRGWREQGMKRTRSNGERVCQGKSLAGKWSGRGKVWRGHDLVSTGPDGGMVWRGKGLKETTVYGRDKVC